MHAPSIICVWSYIFVLSFWNFAKSNQICMPPSIIYVWPYRKGSYFFCVWSSILRTFFCMPILFYVCHPFLCMNSFVYGHTFLCMVSIHNSVWSYTIFHKFIVYDHTLFMYDHTQFYNILLCMIIHFYVCPSIINMLLPPVICKMTIHLKGWAYNLMYTM